jgi:murein L,D-transpeptidase YafK
MPTWIRHTASTLTLLAMAVQASAYAQPSQPPKRTSAQAQQAAAKNQRSAAPSKRAAAKPAAPVAPPEGRGREALAQAESLAREHPNFQLAQLAVGDLLAARVRPVKQLGDVPEPPLPYPPEVIATLDELRTESRQRVQAQRNRPASTHIPAQFVELAPRYKHAIAVDASRSRLYLFENTDKGLKLVADYYASVGKLGIEKATEGDQRTPLGVYFITSRLDPATLKDFYGAGALPINYPNPLDQVRGKTGSGIWLHGTPPDQFSRAPLATDGCVALANPDLERILRTVEPRSTPVVIAKQLQWVQAHSVQAERNSFEAVLNAWSAAKSEGNMNRLLGFYAPTSRATRKSPCLNGPPCCRPNPRRSRVALSTSRTRLTCAGRTRPTPWW